MSQPQRKDIQSLGGGCRTKLLVHTKEDVSGGSLTSLVDSRMADVDADMLGPVRVYGETGATTGDGWLMTLTLRAQRVQGTKLIRRVNAAWHTGAP